MLKLENISIGYDSAAVVRNISLRVKPGEIVGLIGRNGSGKSTIMRGIAGILTPASGAITFRDHPIIGMLPQQIIRRGMSYVAQGHECFPDLTVVENLKAAGLTLQLTGKELLERREKVLSQFPAIAEHHNRPAHRLSGGMLQMLCIGMALMHSPACLLLDEPTMGLAGPMSDMVLEILKAFAEAKGAILIVEQKPKLVFEIASQMHYLESGEIVVSGVPELLKRDQLFINRFLGTLNKDKV